MNEKCIVKHYLNPEEWFSCKGCFTQHPPRERFTAILIFNLEYGETVAIERLT
jgi:hypothetical protein